MWKSSGSGMVTGELSGFTSMMSVSFSLTLLIGKQDIGVFIPEDAVVAHALILNHLFQFRPNGSVPFGILFLEAWLQEHLECKSFHLCYCLIG